MSIPTEWHAGTVTDCWVEGRGNAAEAMWAAEWGRGHSPAARGDAAGDKKRRWTSAVVGLWHQK